MSSRRNEGEWGRKERQVVMGLAIRIINIIVINEEINLILVSALA